MSLCRVTTVGPSWARWVARKQATVPLTRPASTWSDVVATAKEALTSGAPASAAASSVQSLTSDPLDVVGKDLSSLRHNIASLLGSGHPSLDRIAKYYFAAEGKHVRPMIVLLMAKATNGLSAAWGAQRAAAVGEDVDVAISPSRVLNDYNPSAPRPRPAQTQTWADGLYTPQLQHTILPTQQRLAEITEMIHVASLLHDDVIDASPLRRGAPSAPSTFGNKLSILGGDFLLGRASIALARLRDPEVIELMSTVIANLVEGEVMQLKAQVSDQVPVTDVDSSMPAREVLDRFWTAYAPDTPTGPSTQLFQFYLQKTYLKTASLIAKSARSATVLGGCGHMGATASELSEEHRADAAAICDAAYTYGRHVGIAFQLVDDLLDFHATTEAFGKPSGGADLQLGLATAPVLYAWQEFPTSELGTLVQRRFSEPGDVEKALGYVHRSQGLPRTAALARYHADVAQKALRILPESDARGALEKLNQQIITRAK
ncbi:Coq1 putative hexaprenyl diphosphate synthase [Malassezia pachydermatis]|uniref:(2E,6E)-farnesyl diphosphate synthase n=1 Tax=Malassezia pachydermatis TaxID=77020 RepID=A0A0M9VNE7_9BASI|nr:coq1-hexaprenyl pyrophosphate synthetase precursor [Malassezia pachydermatis]KOS13285.1 coq1-hexaprenyl pyrophosphate synthetase precursor [Malassezia pachydermatis]